MKQKLQDKLVNRKKAPKNGAGIRVLYLMMLKKINKQQRLDQYRVFINPLLN